MSRGSQSIKTPRLVVRLAHERDVEAAKAWFAKESAAFLAAAAIAVAAIAVVEIEAEGRAVNPRRRGRVVVIGGRRLIIDARRAIDDDGFRDFSDAEIRRGYADLGVKGDNAEFHFNFTGAENFVGVTAAVPPELLAYGRERTFTSPQTTDNEMQMFSFISHRIKFPVTQLRIQL